MVRQGNNIAVYLNGKTTQEISGEVGSQAGQEQVFIGGGNDHTVDFYGKICDVSIYTRALTPQEITEHYLAAAGK